MERTNYEETGRITCISFYSYINIFDTSLPDDIFI